MPWFLDDQDNKFAADMIMEKYLSGFSHLFVCCDMFLVLPKLYTCDPGRTRTTTTQNVVILRIDPIATFVMYLNNYIHATFYIQVAFKSLSIQQVADWDAYQ